MNRMNLIVAACENMGIGMNGSLPWNLKKEMKYFNQMTTTTVDSEKQNAVVMGRKTWFSIPERYRPLANRINVVLSKELRRVPDGAHYLAAELDFAIKLLENLQNTGKVERIWIIGGSTVYKEAMESSTCGRVYFTEVMANFDCDTFFPPIPKEFKQISDPSVAEEIQEEGGIKYKFKVYEKVCAETLK